MRLHVAEHRLLGDVARVDVDPDVALDPASRGGVCRLTFESHQRLFLKAKSVISLKKLKPSVLSTRGGQTCLLCSTMHAPLPPLPGLEAHQPRDVGVQVDI